MDFTSKVRYSIPIDFCYTVFIKVRYNVDKFFMAGNQCGFNYTSDYVVKDLFTVVSKRLEDYMSDYNLTEEAIVYVQVAFR